MTSTTENAGSSLSASWSLALRGALAPGPLLAAMVGVLATLGWKWGAEIGLATGDYDGSGIIYEIAFVIALLGVVLGAGFLDSWRPITSRWLPAEVFRLGALGLMLSVAVPAVPVLIAGAWLGMDLPGLEGAAALAAALARPVAVGLLLMGFPLRPAPRALALVALCWWIPAAWAPSFPAGSPLGAETRPSLLDRLPITAGSWLAESSTLLALLLAARLRLAGREQPR